MILKQYYLNCLAHASYLIGDEETHTAVIVDPQRDVDQYVDECARQGLEICHVFLTHCHADFVAGHLELRDRAGAKIHMGARAAAEYDFASMKDGDELEFGSILLKVLETPGHTIESISILVYDKKESSDAPHAVLTGDTLFIGDVGRPDLQASIGFSASELASKLYDSLYDKLLPLPDDTKVYPAHGAGSLCGRKMSKETVSTIGEQRRLNYALQPMDRDEFVKLVTTDLPELPSYFSYDAVLNTKERQTLDESLQRALKPLSIDEVLAAKADGAQVLDTRDPGDFARAHLAGSISIGLGGQYASWAGTLLSRDRPIILVAEPGSEQESAMRLGRIGLDNVTGYLESGLQAIEKRRELAEGWDRVVPAALAEALASDDPPVVLDVRKPAEHRTNRIEGSINVPLNHLQERINEIPRDRKLMVHCAGGYRSAIAASILQREGFTKLEELVGGIGSWEAAKYPAVASAVSIPIER